MLTNNIRYRKLNSYADIKDTLMSIYYYEYGQCMILDEEDETEQILNKLNELGVSYFIIEELQGRSRPCINIIPCNEIDNLIITRSTKDELKLFHFVICLQIKEVLNDLK